MHAKEQTLQQILEGSKQYLIPLYQRTYSWKREQIQQLWDDLAAQAALVTSGEVGPGHFLGSLVLAPTSPVAGGVQRWLVVDGQQRLTTLSLMLAALRDHVRAEDEGAVSTGFTGSSINELRVAVRRWCGCWRSGSGSSASWGLLVNRVIHETAVGATEMALHASTADPSRRISWRSQPQRIMAVPLLFLAFPVSGEC